MRQVTAAQNAADGAERRNRQDFHLLHLILDGPIAAGEVLVIQTQSHHNDNLFNLRSSALGIAKGFP